MMRRATIGFILAVFLIGAATEAASAETLPLVKHKTTVEIISLTSSGGNMTIEGDLHSSYRPCTSRRLVGLFRNGERVTVTKSAKNGQFTLTAPDVPGSYAVIAFKHARDCNHLCKVAQTSFTREAPPPTPNN